MATVRTGEVDSTVAPPMRGGKRIGPIRFEVKRGSRGWRSSHARVWRSVCGGASQVPIQVGALRVRLASSVGEFGWRVRLARWVGEVGWRGGLVRWAGESGWSVVGASGWSVGLERWFVGLGRVGLGGVGRVGSARRFSSARVRSAAGYTVRLAAGCCRGIHCDVHFRP
jgi:hypothetical protein